MTRTRSDRRRGAILLVVLVLLALFAVIGLSFVLYSESAATSARIHREALTKGNEVPDPSAAAVRALGQILFPNDPFADQDTYLLSGLTGHDLTRLMYGHRPGFAQNDIPYNGLGLFHEPLTFQTGLPPGPLGTFQIDRAEVLNHTLYLPDPTSTLAPPSQLAAMIDPELTRGNGQLRAGPVTYSGQPIQQWYLPQLLLQYSAYQGNVTGSVPTAFSHVGKNAAYTYPDRNNAAVAVVDPVTGQVLAPSLYRPNLFRSLMGGLTLPPTVSDLEPPAANYTTTPLAMNPNWVLPSGRLKMIRQRRIDNLTTAEIGTVNPPTGLRGAGLWPVPNDPADPRMVQLHSLLSDNPNPAITVTVNGSPTSSVGKFPYPPRNPDGSITGDVQNLRFADGRQRGDSFWVDPHLPTETIRGQKVAPLIAAMVIPLDGRANLSVAGNLKGAGATNGGQVSAMGFGPYEINLAKLLAQMPNADKIVTDRYSYQPPPGGATTAPPPPGMLAQPNQTAYRFYQPDTQYPADQYRQVRPSSYGQVSWSTPPLGSTPQFALPAGLTSNPTYTNYGNSDPTGTTTATADIAYHPSLFNPYSWREAGLTTSIGTHTFPAFDLRRFTGRYSDREGQVATQTYLGAPPPTGRTFNQSAPPPSQAEFIYPAAPGRYMDLPAAVGNRSLLSRGLVTPLSNGQKRPGLAPNHFGDPNRVLAVLPVGNGNQIAWPQFVIPSTNAQTQPPTFDLAALAAGGGWAAGTGRDATIAADGTAGYQNLRAILSGVDLNRPLADYRLPPAAPNTPQQPLGQAPNNVAATIAGTGSSIQPWMDRQLLAKDIFFRLVVAAGARYAVDPTSGTITLPQRTNPGVDPPAYQLVVPGGGPPLTITPEEYNALRWLAQLSANIVDAIDADDISTGFVWNPDPSTLKPANPVDDPLNQTNFAATAIGDRVVFGVEKPRLVVNEAYAEVANDPADRGQQRASRDFRVRFFIELLNPGGAEQANSILAGPDPAALGAVGLRAGTSSAYRVQVFDRGTDVLDELAKPGNVLGAPPATLPTAGQSKILTPTNRLKMDVSTLTNATDPNLAIRVEPNAGQAAAATGARNGFAVIGPQLAAADTEDPAFNPKSDPALTPTTAGNLVLEATVNAAANTESHLDYTIARVNKNEIPGQVVNPLNNDPNRHVVLLQRLANPYLRWNDPADAASNFAANEPTNPYVTVDLVSQVQVNDAIRLGADAAPASGVRTPIPQPQDHHSVGRVQPFAGYQDKIATGSNPSYSYPTTLGLRQWSQSYTTSVQHSLFRHNSYLSTPAAPATPANGAPNTASETLSAPFEWLVHLDRKLVSPADLFHVTWARPHNLTRNFAKPTGGNSPIPAVAFHRHDLQHRAIIDTSVNPAVTLLPDGPLYAIGSPLWRGLDLLTAKPWMLGVPEGGRVPGKVNINMLWDATAGGPTGPSNPSYVFAALLDAGAAGASANAFTQADVATIWAALQASRSPSWTPQGPDPSGRPVSGPSVTLDDLPTPTALTNPNPDNPTVQVDRPFKGFGTALFAAPAPTAYGQRAGSNQQDTLLRRTVNPTDGSLGNPLFRNPSVAHPYLEWEPLRKALNNLTTVSDTYLVLLTVAYFEVLEEDTPRTNIDTGAGVLKTRVLGRERFDRVPGDLRAQYVAVIDRSMLTSQTATDKYATGQLAPWVGELQTPVPETNSPVGGANPVEVRIPAELYEPVGVNPDPRQLPGVSLLGPVVSTPDPNDPSQDVRGLNPSYTNPSNPASAAQYAIGGRYEGQQWTITAESGAGGPNIAGTQFWIGTGSNRQLVEAYVNDASGPAQRLWTYDRKTGTARIFVRPVDPQFIRAVGNPPTQNYYLNPHNPGEAASNVVFGSPGAQGKFDVTSPQYRAVVRFFGKLTP